MPIKKPSFKQKRESLGIRRNISTGKMIRTKPLDPKLRKLSSDHILNKNKIQKSIKLEQKHLKTLSEQFNKNPSAVDPKEVRRSFNRINKYINSFSKLSEMYHSSVKEHNALRQRERYLRQLEPRANKLFKISPELERLFEKKFYKNPFRPLGLETLVNSYLGYIKENKIKSINNLTKEDILKLSKPLNLDWKK